MEWTPKVIHGEGGHFSLEKRGHTVTIVADGAEAVEAFEKNTFDLILMDVHMPQLDGYQATELIRQRESRGHRIPIIALTANAMAGEENCVSPTEWMALFQSQSMYLNYPRQSSLYLSNLN